jgi:hypothetical protein
LEAFHSFKTTRTLESQFRVCLAHFGNSNMTTASNRDTQISLINYIRFEIRQLNGIFSEGPRVLGNKKPDIG